MMTIQRGVTLWFTGLSGAGKTTIARALEEYLRRVAVPVERLDGDVVREELTRDLGFSKEDRDENIRRITFVAKLLTRHNVICLVSFISPYTTMREYARQQIGSFVEVFVDCPLDICEQRDVKGLYKKARSGEVKQFTGISDPYEAPEHPEITIRSDRMSVDESVALILDHLVKEHFVIH